VVETAAADVEDALVVGAVVEAAAVEDASAAELEAELTVGSRSVA
jgi:hypothetical protein